MDYLKAWLACLVSVLIASPSYALLVSEDSVYGTDSITLDTDTGLEWLDVFIPVMTGSSSGTQFNSYSDVKAMMGVGGYLEGFRYATRQELEILLYSSAGIDAERSKSSSTATQADAIQMANLMALTDYTFGTGFGPDFYSRILDAVFEDPDTDSVIGSVLGYGYFGGTFTGGTIQYYEPYSLTSNTNPYGHWLVRDTSVSVDEPPAVALLGFALLFIAGFVRRRS